MQLSSPRLFSTRTAMSVTILSSEAVRAAADISLPPAHTAVSSMCRRKTRRNTKNQCCGFEMFIPDPGSEFFHPGYRVKKIPDPGSGSKNLSTYFFYPKTVNKLSEKLSGCSSRIRTNFFSIADSGLKKAPDPGFKKVPDIGSGTATQQKSRNIGKDKKLNGLKKKRR